MAKPIFCVTHPRACSTAFERVFMTRTKDLTCFHEPFGDPFYFGPERMSARFENDEAVRVRRGYAECTYKNIIDSIEDENLEGKRPFLKDMIYYLMPPNGEPAQIAPSLLPKRRGIGTTRNGIHSRGSASPPPYPYGTAAEIDNPTIVPLETLKKFHYTFLIRNPHSSVPSYFRCTIPPLDEITGFYEFYPNESGYSEIRRFFNYLVDIGYIGPGRAGDGTPKACGVAGNHVNEVCVVDADDLLDNPEGIIKEYCRSVGLDYTPSMLDWSTEEAQNSAKEAFEKWNGWHEDVLNSRDLKPRAHKKKNKTEDEWDAEWKIKFGDEAAKVIRETVDTNMEDYLYLKQFAMRV